MINGNGNSKISSYCYFVLVFYHASILFYLDEIQKNCKQRRLEELTGCITKSIKKKTLSLVTIE